MCGEVTENMTLKSKETLVYTHTHTHTHTHTDRHKVTAGNTGCLNLYDLILNNYS